jgi:lipopolysaccharide biosynthesis glycosyltransferase
VNLKILTVWKPSEFYTEDWLIKIQDSVSRNLKIPHEHICLTDEKLNHCKTVNFSNEGYELDGYWFKIQMFRNLPELSGPCLYFDLDLVITNSLDTMITGLINSNEDVEIYGVKDLFVNSAASLPKHFFNSSILFWKKNPTHLWDRFITQRPKTWKMTTKDAFTHGDQAYISSFCNIGFIDSFCPDKYITRINEYEDGKTSIIFFAGKNKPNSCTENTAIIRHWRTGS